MKLFLKIIMLLVLVIFVYLSLSHLLNLTAPSAGAYWLAIFTIAFLIIYFLVFFLDLEIMSKWVSIKRKMNTLENKQKQLSKIATALYKLNLISIASLDSDVNSDVVYEMRSLINVDIQKYLDSSDIDSFAKKLFDNVKYPF